MDWVAYGLCMWSVGPALSIPNYYGFPLGQDDKLTVSSICLLFLLYPHYRSVWMGFPYPHSLSSLLDPHVFNSFFSLSVRQRWGLD